MEALFVALVLSRPPQAPAVRPAQAPLVVDTDPFGEAIKPTRPKPAGKGWKWEWSPDTERYCWRRPRPKPKAAPRYFRPMMMRGGGGGC